jgi:hypothetical protein
MPFTWEEIERDWLGGLQLAYPSAVVVDAFNRLERAFGPEWVRSYHKGRGAFSTIPVFIQGQTLASLEGLAGTDKLFHLLSQHDEAAWAEATAIYLLRSVYPDADVELYPTVAVGDRVRQPDFRVKRQELAWTYVEVTRPDVSEEGLDHHFAHFGVDARSGNRKNCFL